jgi:hypothetical protein
VGVLHAVGHRRRAEQPRGRALRWCDDTIDTPHGAEGSERATTSPSAGHSRSPSTSYRPRPRPRPRPLCSYTKQSIHQSHLRVAHQGGKLAEIDAAVAVRVQSAKQLHVERVREESGLEIRAYNGARMGLERGRNEAGKGRERGWREARPRGSSTAPPWRRLEKTGKGPEKG